LRGAQQIGEMRNGGDDGLDGVRVGSVGGNADLGEGVDGFETVQTLCDQHQVGMQRGDDFQARVDGASHFGLLLGFGREIAVVRVADQAILKAEREDGLGKIGSERDDSTDGLRNADGAADFIGDLAIFERLRRSGLRGVRLRGADEGGEC